MEIEMAGEKQGIHKAFVLLVVVFCYMGFQPNLEGDTYWLINTGNYIIHNGFFMVDPFTIHEGLRMPIQQWLSAVVFYGVESLFGKNGVYGMMFISLVAQAFLLYAICLIVTKHNRAVSKLMVLAACIFLNGMVKAQPQLFSQVVFLLEILLLENYIVHRKKRHLLLLIALSVLLVNLHAAVWPVFFLLFIPYVLDGIQYKDLTQGYGVLSLATTLTASFYFGVLNPYGTQSMFYFFRIYGIQAISQNMQVLSWPHLEIAMWASLCFLLLILMGMLVGFKGRTTLRHILLLTGAFTMGLSSGRSLFTLVICSTIFAAGYMKFNFGLDAVFQDARKRVVAYCAIVVIVVGSFALKQEPAAQTAFFKEPEGAVAYIRQHIDVTSLRLFNDAQWGGYLEYHGIRTFIDTRYEAFAKKLNQKEDVFYDYENYETGRFHYWDLAKKYDLTHFLIEKDRPISVYLLRDERLEMVYSDERFALLKVKTAQ